MTLLALGLVLAAAVLHATWNLYAKRAGDGGVAFVWLAATLAAVLYLPLGVGALIATRPPSAAGIGFMAGSAVLHVAYFWLLQTGYGVGDLSVVYPLARGTGPLVATVAAVLLFGERPTALALGGALLVSLGVAAVGWGSRAHAERAAVLYGVGTGLVIATYTLWDKHAVDVLAVAPILYDWASNAGRSLLLAPVALGRRATVREVWTSYRREVLVVALLSPAAYILVLTALTFTPVSYVAPAREVSILIGTLLGARLLAEADLRRRLVGAGAIVAGVIALALG